MPIIEEYEAYQLKATILQSAGISYTENNIDDVFESKIKTIEKKEVTYYKTPEDTLIFGFIGRGLWGMIHGIITLQDDLETIANIKIISQEETPGLGARITEEEFLETFERKKFSPKLNLVMRKTNPEINEIAAITGATMTSDALIQMLNDAVVNFRKNVE